MTMKCEDVSEEIMLLQSIHDEVAGVNSFDKVQHIRTMILLDQFGEANGEHILHKP